MQFLSETIFFSSRFFGFVDSWDYCASPEARRASSASRRASNERILRRRARIQARPASAARSEPPARYAARAETRRVVREPRAALGAERLTVIDELHERLLLPIENVVARADQCCT